MALYYFRSLLKEKGLSGVIRADSAATSTEEIGNPVHHGTRAKLKHTLRGAPRKTDDEGRL